MITSSKLNLFIALFLVVFGIVPGMFAEFLLVPAGSRLITLAACILFLAGVLLGSKLVNSGLPRSERIGVRDTNERGILLLGLVLLILTTYVIVIGPTSPIFAAASGFDPLETALLREDALKLNTDALFVRLYSNGRDIIAPAAFVLSLEAVARSTTRPLMRVFALIVLCASIFIGVWSGQKATIINYIIAAMIFLSRDATSLMRRLAVSGPLVCIAVFAMFLITYSGTFDESERTSDLLKNVYDGLIHRLFVGPFEVSIAYVDALDNQKLIHPINAVPIIGAMIRPGFPTIENIIGIQYFFSGIDSISANALCFAYAYIIGGLPFCFVMGALTSVGLIIAMRLVRAGGNVFIDRAFQAMVAYRLLDLLSGNPLSYLFGLFEWAIIGWLIARGIAGLSMIRFPPPPDTTRV